MEIVEQRTVCSECGQLFGLFHKGCDGKWVRQRRTVTEWEPVAPLSVHSPARLDTPCAHNERWQDCAGECWRREG